MNKEQLVILSDNLRLEARPFHDAWQRDKDADSPIIRARGALNHSVFYHMEKSASEMLKLIKE